VTRKRRRKSFNTPNVPPDAKALIEKLRDDHAYVLAGMRVAVEEDRNPAYAWEVIDRCIKRKTDFPDWIRRYLAQCAERMLSDRAKEAREVRDVLPWALGFADVRGNALDSHRDQDKYAFALAFAIRIDNGDTRPDARRNAYNEVFGPQDDVDDRTLQRWLHKVFGLKKKPSVADWYNAITEFYGSPYLLGLLEQGTKSRDFPS
jgi:hypothetical protein